MSKRTGSSGLGSLGSGALTAAALAVQTGLAAVVGVVIARDFGRTAETDGFFAAYGVFIVVVLAATAVRVAVLPPLARARAELRLGAEVVAYAITLSVIALPLVAVGIALPHPMAWLLTGNGAQPAKDTAAATLPWMMAAASLQLFAGLGASALASLDDYLVAAAGYAAGSVLGLGYILLRVHHDGIGAVAHGMTLNGLVVVLVCAAGLLARAWWASMPRNALRPGAMSIGRRLREMASSVALPLALQIIYVICLPLAGREGTGSVTSFGYAYLVAAAVVAVTASSLGLVTSVPLARSGVSPQSVTRHVVSSSWLGIVAVGGVAGLSALVGGRVLHAILGSVYGAGVGSEIGRLVVVFAVWAVASVGIGVTFPLMFVARGASTRLPLVALAAVVLQFPIALAGQTAAGLYGLVLALALTTWLVLLALLDRLQAVSGVVRGLATSIVTVGCLAAVSFAAPRLLVGPVGAALIGAPLYALLLFALRPPGLVHAWRYLRALG